MKTRVALRARSFGTIEETVLRLLSLVRVTALAVSIVTLLITRGDMHRPASAAVFVAIAAQFTTMLVAAQLVRRPELLLAPWVLVIDIAIAVMLQVGDAWVYGPAQARLFPTLGSVWPLATVATIGIGTGARVGAAVGLGVGLSRLIGLHLPNLYPPTLLDFYRPDESLVPALTLAGLYCLVGAASGAALAAVRRGAEELATLRTRDQIARTIHDSALQALVLVQQRSEDPMLRTAAADADCELRAFLAGGAERASGGLRETLERIAAEAAKVHGYDARVFVPKDTPTLTSEVTDAVSGAVKEAMANAGRHGGAEHLVVYVEPGEGGWVFASVRDDGSGYDTSVVVPGFGTQESIINRIHGIGGRVEMNSAVGQGTEVRLWVPG